MHQKIDVPNRKMLKRKIEFTAMKILFCYLSIYSVELLKQI